MKKRKTAGSTHKKPVKGMGLKGKDAQKGFWKGKKAKRGGK